MLDILLAMIGALAILASIAAKFIKLPADATACDAGPDELHDTVSARSSMHSARRCRRARRRARKTP